MSQKYYEYKELFKKGSYIEASNLAELEYFEGNKNNPFWLTRQAAALCRAQKYDRALNIAMQALALQPVNPYCILAVADALYGLKRVAEALQYYEEITSDPKVSSIAQKRILECFSEMKQWDKVLQFLAQWKIPQDTGFKWKIKALKGQNQLDEAIEACSQWLGIDPDNRQALWDLSELEIKRDGLESVLSRMGRIAKIPSRPPVYKEIYASLCKRAGKPELALKQYEKLSQSGTNIWIQKQQAFAFAKSKKYMEAIILEEELLKLDPTDIYLNKSYIASCNKSKQLERALKFYKELVGMHPEEKTIYGRIKTIKKMLESAK